MASPARALPPLDLLRGFDAAARHLSFTRAAAELFLTQSAVSRQIQALDQLRESTRKLRETRQGHVLTVTTTISFAALWLVPRLAHFRKLHPRVDVRVAATHEVLDLEREGVDLAVRDCPLNRAPAGSVFLVGEHLAAMCSPAYAREARRAGHALRKPEDLRHHVLLMLHDAPRRYPWLSWAAWFEAMGVEDPMPAGTLTFDQYDQVINAALHGQGVALGRMTLAGQHVRAKRLVALFGRQQRLARGYHAVFARGAAERPDVNQFVAWIRGEIAAGA